MVSKSNDLKLLTKQKSKKFIRFINSFKKTKTYCYNVIFDKQCCCLFVLTKVLFKMFIYTLPIC